MIQGKKLKRVALSFAALLFFTRVAAAGSPIAVLAAEESDAFETDGGESTVADSLPKEETLPPDITDQGGEDDFPTQEETEISETESRSDNPEEESEAGTDEKTNESESADGETEDASAENESKEADETQADASEPETVKNNETSSSAEQTNPAAADDMARDFPIQPLISEDDFINVVVPTTYDVAFNPYGLEVRMDDDEVSTSQVLSKKYGIVNKSTKDVFVNVTFVVKDLNSEITFVDSDEDAWNAEPDTYAVHLAVVPSEEGEVTIDDMEVGAEVTEGELADVDMFAADGRARTLYGGKNQMRFRLSSAVYEENGHESNDGEKNGGRELVGLASDGTSVTAFTFDGAMNEDADWTKLSKGIKISAIYTYAIADDEEDVPMETGLWADPGEIDGQQPEVDLQEDM